MIINRTNLDTLAKAYNAAFRRGADRIQAEQMFGKVAMTVPSSTAAEVYPWLGQLDGMKEWLGERQVDNFQQHAFTIRNRDWEKTVEVDRNHIEDDEYGVYAMRFEHIGMATMRHPDELVWPLLKAGFTTLCYDGQFFFDTDHPVRNKNGVVESKANRPNPDGTGTPWFLMDLRVENYKPIIFQQRKAPSRIIRMDREEDENVFNRKKFVYGVDCRDNVGFGLWQTAYGSRQALSDMSYAAGFAAMEGMTGDGGAPLGLKPTHLFVPPSLRPKAMEILNAERNSAGATNIWRNTTTLEVIPWLA